MSKEKENRFVKAIEAEEKAATAEAIKEQAEAIKKANEELVKDIKQNDIIDTVKDVKAKAIYSGKTEDGDKIGVSGNKWQMQVCNICGQNCLAMGQNDRELAADKQALQLALARGDINLKEFCGMKLSGKYITAEVKIPGAPPCLTKGTTEEERAEDERQARITAAKLTARWSDVPVAEELIDADMDATAEFEKDGIRYIYFKADKCARDFDGKKVADITDITDKLADSTAIELLKSRIVTPEYDDAYDDEYDDYEEEYEEGEDNGCEDFIAHLLANLG